MISDWVNPNGLIWVLIGLIGVYQIVFRRDDYLKMRRNALFGLALDERKEVWLALLGSIAAISVGLFFFFQPLLHGAFQWLLTIVQGD